MGNWFKSNGIHFAIIGIFIAICFVYFSPALQGKVLAQSDVLQAKAMQKEIMDYKTADGRGPLWTNAMFGGMPSYQIWVQYPYNFTTYIISAFVTSLPNPIGIVFLYLLGAYLLFCTLRMSPWLAAAGAIAFAFSSYNFIIIEAGHGNKGLAIAFFAPIVAGILLVFKRRFITGGALLALALALEIRANHIQMTYYLFISLLILVGIELYHAVKNKELNVYLKALGTIVLASVLAMAVNAATLWTTYEYGQESIRGKSNLTAAKNDVKSTGLNTEYAYQWSQGVGENITFLIPGAYGGSSVTTLKDNSNVVKTLTEKGVPDEQAKGFAQSLPSYWGSKPFTSGPWYFGAIICFLFVLGLFVIQNRIKWWIVGATLLSIFLSFGKNLPVISDLFFYYFPLYNKFRAVESTLVIAGFLFPLLAILTVKELAFHTEEPKKLLTKLKYSAYTIGGIIVIVLLVPTMFFSFKAPNHEQFVQQLNQVTGGDATMSAAIANALVSDRVDMARADALRSLIFVLIGAGLCWALITKKVKPVPAFLFFGLAILIDMWMIDKRYLNNEKFAEKSQLDQQFQPRQVDELILRDQSLNYRVFDLSISDPFSNATSSYFHKTIGGYHAAKLKRFQEVLEKQFSNAINEDVLDMLNTKYVITADEKNQSQRIQNRSTACGNAWFVDNITFVKNADQEMQAISSFDPKKEAFIHESFKSLIDFKKAGPAPGSVIKLTNYRPDHLTYEYSAGRNAIAVFAEVWYDKGWNAYVDGEKIPHFRANYILRAAELPGGNHKLEFKFEPASYYTGETISLIASILLLAALGASVYLEYKRRNKEVKTA